MPNWNTRPKDRENVEETYYLIIKPACLNRQSDGTVFVTINETTCGHGYKLVSCAPYIFKVLPVYELPSANGNLFGWENETQTLPLLHEASVTNLSIQDIGARWISVSWPMPACRIPVSEWNLTELSSNDVVILPQDCPTFVNSSHLILNISDSIVCSNSNFSMSSGLSIIPCISYNISLNVKYLNLDMQIGNNNTIATKTKFERKYYCLCNLTNYGN